MNLQEMKERLFRERPDLKKEYERFDLWFELDQLWLRLKMWWRSKGHPKGKP